MYTREGPCGVVLSTNKGTVPTAKVPNYVKRLGQGMRDNRPGLLPTPSIPPMRGHVAASMGYSTPLSGGGMYQRLSSLSPLEDAYATPYATKPRHTVKIEDYETSAGSCDVSPPPGFDSISQTSLSSGTPPGFENVAPLLGCSPQHPSNQSDLLSSLLCLLSQQMTEPAVKGCFTDPVLLSTTVTSLTSTAGPCTPLNSRSFEPTVGMTSSQNEWRAHHDLADKVDSEKSILDSIVGFYIPSDSN